MRPAQSKPLSERLTDLIRRNGPIAFRDWMKAALYDATEGYYNRVDLKRWGREGDYRTSPERSELFAATFARYFAGLYDELQRPNQWTIVEAGPGDGRFAAGVLQSFANKFPQVFNASRYTLLELSSDAREHARKRLGEFGDRVQFASIQDLEPVEVGISFSNELLDAFPVHRLIQIEGELSELYVTVDSDGKFAWSSGPLSKRLAEYCREYSLELESGQIVEINLAIDDWLMNVAAKLKKGFLITVDYGAEAGELYDFSRRPQGTLRAFARHGFVPDVLAQPGEYDITSSVNWTQVKAVGARLGFKLVDFTQQDQFLLGAGLLEELQQRLAISTSTAENLSLSTSAREMILPNGMASSFQVLVQQRVEEE